MRLPFGFPGILEYMDAGPPPGGVGGATAAASPKPPWTVLSSRPSSNALHKMLADLSYSQHLKSDQALPPGTCPPQIPFPRYPADCHLKHLPYSATSWVQQLQGSLPSDGFNVSAPSELKDPGRHFSPHISLNGGSLVLDTARGELVNASKMTPKEILEAKALAASKSHSEAERRRRERINSHLNTLRKLLPSSTKTDKASLLAEVIDQVKMLKRQVTEIYEYGPMPTDHDELSVERDPASGDGKLVIKASLCCDDRPELLTDLRHALETLRLRTLKAEISTLGGRIKNVFIMTMKEDTTEQDQDISVKCVQEALREVMERAAGGELSPGSSNKRQRLAPLDAAGFT